MTPAQCAEALRQIGPRTVLAISGGRSALRDGVLVLPVAHGYSVEVELDEGRDLYEVRRVFTRGLRRFVKGEVHGVYCDDLSEQAYRASCYLDGWQEAS